MARISEAEAGGINVLAFLDLIAYSEIKPGLLAQSNDGYNVLVGSLPGHAFLFQEYDRHPHVLSTRENSTAAGRYQIIFPTWRGVSGEHDLKDFSPISQDRAAIELARGRGAIPYIARNDIASAVIACSHEWASFPNAGYGQHENTMAELLAAFNTARAKYA